LNFINRLDLNFSDLKSVLEKEGKINVSNDTLHLIQGAETFLLQGDWFQEDGIEGSAYSNFGLPISYDYIISIQGSNAVIYPDDIDRFTDFMRQRNVGVVSIRLITAGGDVKRLNVKGRFVPMNLTTSVQSPDSNSIVLTKQEIEDSKRLLESVIQSDIMALSVFKPVFNKEGEIIDFLWVIANKLQRALCNGRDLIGKRYLEIFPKGSPNERFAWLKQVYPAAGRTVDEFYYQDHYIRGWFRGVYVRANELLIASAEDITYEKNAASMLLKNFQIMQQTEAVAGIGSWEFALADQGFTWSEGMYKIFDLGREKDVAPEIYLDYVIAQDRALAEKMIERIKQIPAAFEETITIKVGAKLKVIKVKANVVSDKEGKPVKVLGVNFDITAISESAQLKELNSRLRELDRIKTEFFNNVSHEFRTPITLILGPLQDVMENKQGTIQPDDLEKLKMVNRNGVRLRKLVNNLLDFASIEAGKLEAFYQPTDIVSFTEDLSSNFRSLIEKAGLRYVVKLDPVDEPIYINHEMWEKIVLNLISNAFKFTQHGRIEVLLNSMKKHIRLTVRDTGAGISNDNIPRIFERFARIENAKARTYEGSGIGLALVKELVAMHGGTIKVNSTIGEGSEFIISIPKGKAHLPASQIFSKAEVKSPGLAPAYLAEMNGWLSPTRRYAKSSSDVAQESTAPQKRKPVVLVADDNADMRSYLKNTLADYSVNLVEDGTKALEVLEKGYKPDLILTDVMMPEMDGFELIQHLQSHLEYKKIPVILLSARSDDAFKIEGIAAGAIDCLSKPFSSKELNTLVEARIQMARLRNDTERLLEEKKSELATRVLERTRALEESERLLSNYNEQLQQILDAIPQMVWVEDASGKIKYVNDRWHSYTGLSKEQSKERGIHHCKIFHASQEEEIAAKWNTAVKELKRYTGEVLVRDSMGNHRWHLHIAEPIVDRNNNLLLWVGSFTDMHDQFISDKQLKESRDLMEAVFNASPNAISVFHCAHDDDGNVEDFEWRYFNVKAQECYKTKDLMGCRLKPILVKHKCLVVFDKLKEVLQTGQMSAFEYTVDYGSKQSWYLMVVVKLEDSLIVSQQDITERVRSNQKLLTLNERMNRTNIELKIKNEELTNFAFLASHDLKEPIRKIQLFANVLMDAEGGNMSAKGIDYTARIMRSVNRLNALIDDILSFSRVGEVGDQLMENVDLNEQLALVVAEMESEFSKRNGKLTSDPLPTIAGFSIQISQLLQNLVSNAIKFQSGEHQALVSVRGEFVNGDVIDSPYSDPRVQYFKLEIVDNGIGFEEQYATKIFKMFQRLHAATDFSGTGMGLAICKRIMENHHGFIVAQSRPGQGSTFSCYFPEACVLKPTTGE
jgi:PAS domain S-box-containing protein